ncbi:MAG: hypothetical protein IAI49_01635 [Candidatus Eremiobacteraeota bacterium]|nr:hypothetical protein [Candidatus Eremiobacteraeota bacterium]
MDVIELRSYVGRRVCVLLDDASEHVGELRTELLSEKSISVFLKRTEHDGATIYIDDIVAICPLS